MSNIDLESKFPDMRPLKIAPSMTSLLGCGFRLYGARNHDVDTNSDVRTHYFCLFFLPVLALGAYRVTPAGPAWSYLGRLPVSELGKINGGWYFFGRVPLAATPKLCNILLFAALLAAAGFLAWDKYTHSESYRAGQKMAEAERLAGEGQVAAAARLYGEVAQGGTGYASEAMARIKGLLDGPAAKAVPKEAAVAFQVAAGLRHRPGAVGDLFDRGMKLAEKHSQADPRGALLILDAVTPLATDAKALAAARRRSLERLVLKEPTDPKPAVELAVLYEASGEGKKCEKLLEPHRHRLGNGEGARILGQIDARKGRTEEAYALLAPYVESRLRNYQEAETRYKDAFKEADERIINQLKNRQLPDFPYDRYRVAAPQEREAIVNEYMTNKLKADPTIQAAREAYQKEAGVVPVAFDLGMVLLRRAQTHLDFDKRRQDLQKAEKMFLDIRGAAGQDDQYRLSLAQVYYWLGKHDEGRKLFDQVLANQKRSFTILLSVARLLREVGGVSEARALAEEAYNKEPDQRKKYQAAIQRAFMNIDLDDDILWLGRADPNDFQVQASLHLAKGNKATQEGQDAKAAEHYQKAIDIYARQPVEAAVLNNGANAYAALYAVTGKAEALDKAAAMYEKAVSLQPSNSILLSNAARSALEVAFRDIIGPAVDLRTLKTGGSLSLLAFLYNDRAGRDKYIAKVRKHAGVAKARRYYERLLVLAPKRPGNYSTLAGLHQYTHDLAALRALARRLAEVSLDLADQTREALKGYKGEYDEKNRKEWKAAEKRFADLVSATRKKPGGTTFAIAADHLISTRLALDTVGVAVDFDDLVALAEEADKAAPSSATRATLKAALLARASRTLAGQQADYQAMVKRALRSLGTSYLIPVALGREAKLRDAVLANKDVQRAIVLVKEDADRFPDRFDTWSWAMLQNSYPEEAKHMAETIRKDEPGKIGRSMDLKLSPVSAAGVFRVYWAQQIIGKGPEDIDVLKACARRGVPLPFDPK
jgi:tetratricopeptide (TPR) repeat protein